VGSASEALIQAGLAIALEQAADSIVIADPSGKMLFVNPMFTTQTGYTAEEAIGQFPRIHRSGKHPREFYENLWKTIQSKQIWQGEVINKRKDGTLCTESMRIFPVLDAQGEITSYVAIKRNVTEYRKTEETLRENAEALYEAQRIGGLGCYVMDISANRWVGTDVLNEIFGIDQNFDCTLIGWQSLVHPADRAMMTGYFLQEVIEQRKPFDKQYRIVRQNDHEVRWVHGTGKLVFDSQGMPLKMHGIVRDITEHKIAEMQLRESEMRFRDTFEQAAVGIVHCSIEGRYLRCNQLFAQIVGYPMDEVPGLTYLQTTASEYRAQSKEIHQQLLNGEIDHTCWEKQCIRKDGSRTWIRVTVSLRRDSEGHALHFLQFVEDINSQKLAEQQLIATQEALQISEEHYRTIFQASLDGIALVRVDNGRYVDINPGYLNTLGYERQEVIGRTVTELNIWANPKDQMKLVDAIREHKNCPHLEAQFRKKDGTLLWGMLSASFMLIDGVPCVLSITRNITEIKASAERLEATSQALRISEEHYRTVFHTSLDCIAITHMTNGICIDINQGFLNALGFERQEVLGRSTLDLGVWMDPNDRQKFVDLLDQQSQCRNLDAKFRKKNGEVISGLISASIIEIDGSRCILSFARDISDLKNAEEKIRNLAFYDPLTGLPNRRLLLDRLQQSLAAGARSGLKRALLFIDLDNFKTLNDTLGHHTGDLLLQEAARRLLFSVREADTVARLGGDEFVVMLDNLSGITDEAATQVETIGKKILAALEQTYWLDGRECLSSSSIGAKIFGDHAESVNDILQHADIALYQAKAAGRNTMRFYAPALQVAIHARASMEKDLRHAIKAGQFVLYYQPQLDSDGLIGAETLIRWNHPIRGVLSPGEFIPLAEETGLILPLGDWVLETTCKQIAAWSGRKLAENLSVAVNISARQFRQPDFVQRVLATLERTGACPQHLKLELTESMLLDNVEEIIARMSVLKSHGMEFSLDDFGTGYSSLAYLRRLPLDQLKIDRSFVWDMLIDSSSRAIVQTIISLGKAMGLQVTAEGVETEEQRDYLFHLGCHSFQGFLFSHPLQVEEFEALPCFTSSRGCWEHTQVSKSSIVPIPAEQQHRSE
jgi:diguanylate cyclase (GGDEF)-like protein/PAS domain S-box-containing protein